MAVTERNLQGNARCFTRRARKIELEEGDVKAYFQFSLIRRILGNWFRSIELRNEEDKVRDAIELLLAGTPEEDVPEEMYHTYKTVRSILRTDGEFDLWTPDFDRKKAELVVKLASRKRYLPEMIERNFFEMDFETWETKVIKSQEALRNLYRYIDEEKRTDMIWPDKPYYVNLFGMMVEIFPHAIHIDERSRTIEVIKYSAGKPELAFKSRNEDAGINTSLRLFALWMLGKSFIPDGNGWRIKASIYYLRKPNDTKKWESGYFGLPGGQSPIRTLEEGGVYADTFSKTEALFEPQVEAFRVGRECDGKDCDGCDLKSVCHFNSPPLQTEIPRKRKTITDLELSGSQEEAIYFREGILRVNAGAGAGKTMVVALRISIMLSEGVLPKDILLITFTDAAAAEMKERIAMYNEDLGVDVDLSELGCMTFNAFGNEIVKTEYDKLGFMGIPRLIDDIEKKDIVLKLLSDHHITGIDYRNILMDLPNAKGGLAVVCKGFEIIKTRRFSSYDEDEFKSAMASAGYSNWIKGTKAYGQMLKLFEVYDEELRNRGLIEFADQERLVFDLLDIDPYYFDKLAYKHITVDEFQDTSPTQLELVRQLVETGSFESLMIVGDDSQSIYSFRNADPTVFLDFFDKIGQIGKDIQIVQNHRSTPEILGFANKINELNENRFEKDLLPTRDPGEPVEVQGFYTKDAEYKFITEKIRETLDKGYAPEDIAVITKTNAELAAISGYLTEAGIESSIKAPLPMLENSRVDALVSLAKAYRNINATQHVLNIENCLLGGKILEKDDAEIQSVIEQGQERIKAIKTLREPKRVEAFDELVNEIAGDDEIALKLVNSISRFYTAEDKVAYIEKFNKFGGEKVKREGKYSGVILSTSHSSKGLEYPVVFNSISKYDDDRVNTSERLEEARRLFFVSATRAMDELYVTSVFRRGGSKDKGYVYNRLIQEALQVTGKKLGKDYSLEDPELAKSKAKKIQEAKERIAKENAETAVAEEAAKANAKKLPKKPVKNKKKKAS